MAGNYETFHNAFVSSFTDHPDDIKVFTRLVEKYELEEVLEGVPLCIVSSKRVATVAPVLVPSYNYPVKVEQDGNTVQLSVVIEEMEAYGEDNPEGITSLKSMFVREVAHYHDLYIGLYNEVDGVIYYNNYIRDAKLVGMISDLFEASGGKDEIITEAFFKYCPWEMDYIVHAMKKTNAKCGHYLHFEKVIDKIKHSM